MIKLLQSIQKYLQQVCVELLLVYFLSLMQMNVQQVVIQNIHPDRRIL